MRLQIRVILCLIAVLSASGLAADHDKSNDLTLREALARALRRSPELGEYPFEERAAEARILQASLRPNPEVSVLVEDFAGTRGTGILSDSQTTLELSQLLEIGGKRAARIREAQAGKMLVHFDYETKRLDVFRETAQQFYEVLGGQQRVALNAEIVKLAEEFTPVLEQRLAAGKASTVEATRNDLAIATAKIGLEQAKSELAAARRSLAAMWGAQEPDFGDVAGDLNRVKAPDAFGRYLAMLDRNPAIARWREEAEKRKATVAKELAAAKPDVTFSAGPRWQNGTDDATLVAGFSVPLPLVNKNEGNIREAQIMVEKVAAERRTAEVKLTAEAGAAYEQMLKANAEIEILTKTILPTADAALKAVIDGYTAGKFTQLDVLEARRAIVDARTQYLQALVDYHKAAAQLDALCGATSKPRTK